MYGMCVVCGSTFTSLSASANQDQDQVAKNNRKPNQNQTGISNRNSINVITVSGGNQLQINSSAEAKRIETAKINHLHQSRKLALVLDLDHTLLHAITVEGPYKEPVTKRCVL